MTLDPRLSAFRTALLAALGLSPFVACGGSTSNDPGGPEEAGSGPETTGGRATPTGGAPALGGRPATGGASSGGRGGSGGSVSVVGGKANAGAGGMATAGSPPIAGGRAATGGEAGMGGATRSFECLTPSTARPAGGGASIVAPKPEPFVECDGGWRHRPVAQECPSGLPRADEVPATAGMDECTSDADCVAQANGWCATAAQHQSQEITANLCQYGCVSDD